MLYMWSYLFVQVFRALILVPLGTGCRGTFGTSFEKLAKGGLPMSTLIHSCGSYLDSNLWSPNFILRADGAALSSSRTCLGKTQIS